MPATAPPEEKHELDLLIEQAEDEQDDTRGDTWTTAHTPTYSPNLGLFNIADIYEMGEGEIIIQDERQGIEQPRKDFKAERLTALQQSMVDVGQLTPITLRRIVRNGVPALEIISGARRFRAAKARGETTILGHLLDVENNRRAYMLNVIEEAQQESHNVMEKAESVVTARRFVQEEVAEAWAYMYATGPDGTMREADWTRAREKWQEKKVPWYVMAVLDKTYEVSKTYKKGRKKDFVPEVSWNDLSRVLGLTRQYLTTIAKLVELPEDIQEQIAEGNIGTGDALAVLSLGTPRAQRQLIREIKAKGLTHSQILARAKELKAKEDTGSKSGGANQKDNEEKQHPVMEQLNPALSHIATAATRLRTNPLAAGEIHAAKTLMRKLRQWADEIDARLEDLGNE